VETTVPTLLAWCNVCVGVVQGHRDHAREERRDEKNKTYTTMLACHTHSLPLGTHAHPALTPCCTLLTVCFERCFQSPRHCGTPQRLAPGYAVETRGRRRHPALGEKAIPPLWASWGSCRPPRGQRLSRGLAFWTRLACWPQPRRAASQSTSRGSSSPG
jgi:hypothetical protein